MKWYFVLIATAFLAVARAAPAAYPVCIVGAGPAGLAAANRLEGLGRTTTIFEQHELVGGKCQAVYQGGLYFPLGALLFTEATYTETVKIINSTGVPYVPYAPGAFYGYNWATGVTQLDQAPPAAFDALLEAEIARYITYWETNFAPYSVVPGYKNGVPQEWTVTTAQWLQANDYQALTVLINGGMFPYGYGDLRQVPILYMLQYFTPEIIVDLASVQNIFLIDFHEVFTRFAKNSVKGEIHLSTMITKIERSGSNPVITYQEAEDNLCTQTCSDLVLAFPPTLSALQAANLDISSQEEEVFSPVGHINYYSGAVRSKNPLGAFTAEGPSPGLPPDANGEPVAFLHLWNTSNIATTYSWGAYRGNQTLSQARGLLKSTLSLVEKSLNPGARNINGGDVLAFLQHDYFPHFDPAQLAAGFYGKFNALQGQQHTYYASGLNMFETVEFAIRAGYDIADSYF